MLTKTRVREAGQAVYHSTKMTSEDSYNSEVVWFVVRMNDVENLKACEEVYWESDFFSELSEEDEAVSLSAAIFL